MERDYESVLYIENGNVVEAMHFMFFLFAEFHKMQKNIQSYKRFLFIDSIFMYHEKRKCLQMNQINRVFL